MHRNIEPRGGHSNILKEDTQDKSWRAKDMVLFLEPQQHFEVVTSKT